ncbi:MAG: cryptochrome/photolyase family protein [Desulfopila sp.]
MASTLRLILGDQLNTKHSWFDKADDEITYVMMEIRQETDYITHHIQKIVAFFAGMRKFADRLVESGHHVHYLALDDPQNRHDLSENIRLILSRGNYATFEYLLPDEYRLDQQLKTLCSSLDIETASHDTQHFLTARQDLAEFFGPKKYLMETFYHHIRRQNNWLMHGDKPVGGQWNYDKENRKALPKGKDVVKPLEFCHDVTDIVALITSAGVTTMGEIDSEHFIWPLDRSECDTMLRFFFRECFADYGRYQDAMHTDYWSLFHSRLSFALNSKMLNPGEVVERALSYYDDHGDIDLATVEGFVRQIIGWREFMRGVYWAKMPGYANSNTLNHNRRLPDFYWTGKTRMNCLKHAIRQSLDHAYAHHIQRLMITGNFALLAGVDPDEVDEWYLGIYIDAIEWVEITNTRGMSQFADGGIFATKPYVSSANYINKMSNYCGSCHYSYKKRVNHNACPFNSLYWYFLDRHRQKFVGNHRMRMMYSLLDKMKPAEKKSILTQAEWYLNNLNTL